MSRLSWILSAQSSQRGSCKWDSAATVHVAALLLALCGICGGNNGRFTITFACSVNAINQSETTQQLETSCGCRTCHSGPERSCGSLSGCRCCCNGRGRAGCTHKWTCGTCGGCGGCGWCSSGCDSRSDRCGRGCSRGRSRCCSRCRCLCAWNFCCLHGGAASKWAQLSMAILRGNEPCASKTLQPRCFISCETENCICCRTTGIVSIPAVIILIFAALSSFTSSRVATTVLSAVVCYCIRNGIRSQPSTAVVLCCYDWSIFTVCQAKVCVQHHFVSIKGGVAANVTTLPLVLTRISADSQFRNPTFCKQWDVIIVIELPGVLWITPPSVVSRIADICTA